MTWIAVGVSAGLAVAGAGTEAYANHQALNKQQDATAAGLIRQEQFKQQAEADTSQNVKQAQQNSQNVQKNQTALNSEYAAALNRAAPVQGTEGSLPGASKRYASDVAAASAANKTFGQNYASTAAAVGAPALTNLQTQEGLGDTATKVGMLNDESNQANSLTQMQVNGIIANPWLQAVGAALGGASKGYGSYAGYKGAASNAGTPGWLGSGTGGTPGAGDIYQGGP